MPDVDKKKKQKKERREDMAVEHTLKSGCVSRSRVGMRR
jgi:hypothetical protein